MTNQIKYLLAPFALSVLVGCGKPEASKPSMKERNPEAWKKFCERVRSGEFAESFKEGGIERGTDPEEIAQGIRNAEWSCEDK